MIYLAKIFIGEVYSGVYFNLIIMFSVRDRWGLIVG